MAGKAASQLVPYWRQRLTVLNLIIERPFTAAVIGGDIEVGSIKEAPHLLVDRRKELSNVLRHRQRPANFIDDGKLGNALLAILEQLRIAHCDGNLIGQPAKQTYFVRRNPDALGTPIANFQQADRFSVQPQRHKGAHQGRVSLTIENLTIEAI